MHCYICDKLLRDEEIHIDETTGKSEPCFDCKASIPLDNDETVLLKEEE